MAEGFEGRELSEAERVELYGLDARPEKLLQWMAPGQASLDFLKDSTLTSFLMGPVGQGKTTTVCLKRVHDGVGQGIGRDGWVRDRALILRKTWRTAQQTIVKSWQSWFDRDFAGSTWVGGEDRPATHTLRFLNESRAGSLNPVKVEIETQFRGLDENNIEEILKGAEYSRIVLDEADQFSLNVLETAEERVGRFPAIADLADGERRTRQVTGALNAPDKSNYLYDTLVEKPVPNRRLWTAPAGLLVNWNSDGTLADYRVNPDAENLKMLDADYYTSKAATWETWRVRRFILNEWGYSRDGLPVFVEDFREHLHIAKQLIEPNPRLPLIIGADGSTGGLRPAGVFLQPDGAGFLNLVMTVAPGQGYGAVRFWELMKETRDVYFRGCTDVEIWSDPASQYGGDKEGGQFSFRDYGEVIMGKPVRIPFGGSNEIALRLDAVRAELRRVVSGDARCFRISPHPSNKIVMRGFASDYRFKKRPAGSSSEWEPLPDKAAICSDPMDALQYGIGGYRRITARKLAGDDKGPRAGGEGGWGQQRRADFDVHRM